MMPDFSRSKVGLAFILIVLAVGGFLGWLLLKQSLLNNRGKFPGMNETFEPQMDESKIESRVRRALAQRFTKPDQVSQTRIEVLDIQAREWPDACLGVKREDEVCAQVITPGYEVKARVGDQTYSVHTDRSLQQLVIIDPNGKVVN